MTFIIKKNMGIQVNILEDGEGVEILAFDVVHGYEIIQAQSEIYDKTYLSKQKYHIIDKSKCTEYDVTADDIAAIADFDEQAAKINPSIVVAIIESETLRFSLTEAWQARVEDFVFKTKSFSERSKALLWIEQNKIK